MFLLDVHRGSPFRAMPTTTYGCFVPTSWRSKAPRGARRRGSDDPGRVLRNHIQDHKMLWH